MGYKYHLISIRNWLTDPSRIKFDLSVLIDECLKPKYPDEFSEIGLSSQKSLWCRFNTKKGQPFVVGFKPLNSEGYCEFSLEPETPKIIML